VKPLDRLGDKERAIVEERRRTGYRRDVLEYFGGSLEPQLRALIARLLPGVPASIDLASFVDVHAADPIGSGDRRPGVPPMPELLRRGLEALAERRFAGLAAEEQDALIARMRHGRADEELGLPAKEFVDGVLDKALVGYLAHPDTWERIGFHGPAYPEGYAWIAPGAVKRRHEGFPGAARA
jgi:gluconate 2-dehydrogenase subunit 3-like protein